MSVFAKLFTIDGRQVVVHKDFENQDDATIYRIVMLVDVDGGAQQVGYGYKSEEKRDAKFDSIDEEGTRLSLNVVLAAFGIP